MSDVMKRHSDLIHSLPDMNDFKSLSNATEEARMKLLVMTHEIDKVSDELSAFEKNIKVFEAERN